MTPRDRIQKLVADGRIGQEEGARLVATLERVPLAKLDPFVRFGGGIAAVVGIAGVVACLAIARLGVRFDGVLDLHVGHVPSLRLALLDQAAAFVVPVVAFWAYARTQNAHVRLVDFIGMIGLGRVPVIIGALPLVALAPPAPESLTAIHVTASLVLVAFLAFVMLGLQIALFFFGFRNASGLSGKRLGIGFAAVLVGAEIVSKLLLLVH